MNIEEKNFLLRELSDEKNRVSHLEKQFQEETSKCAKLQKKLEETERSLTLAQKNLLTTQRRSRKETKTENGVETETPETGDSQQVETLLKEKQDLITQIEQLRNEKENTIKTLQLENKELQTQLERANAREQELNQLLDDSKTVVNVPTTEGSKPSSSELFQVQAKLKRTEKQLEVFRKKFDEETQKRQKIITSLEADKKSLKQELESTKQNGHSTHSPQSPDTSISRPDSSQALSDLQTKYDKLYQESLTHNQVVSGLRTQLEQLHTSDSPQSKVSSLQQQLREAEKNLAKKDQEFLTSSQTLKEKISLLTQENLRLQAHMDQSTNKTASPVSVRHGDLQQRVLQLDTELNQALKREETLRHELQHERERLEELKSGNASVDDLKYHLKLEREAKQHLLLQLETEKRNADAQRKKAEQMEKLCDRHQSTLEQLQKIHEEERLKLTDETETLKLELQDVKAQFNRLVKSVEQDKLQMELQTIASLKEQISELKKVYHNQTEFFSWAKEYSQEEESHKFNLSNVQEEETVY